MRTRVWAFAVCGSMASACGGGDSSPDARVRPDAPVDAAPAPCTVSAADFGDVTVINPLGLFVPGNTAGVEDDYVAAGGRLEQDAPHDSILVELFADLGAFAGGGITPGTYTLSGDDLQYRTCGICVRVVTDVVDTYVDDYLATAGTVTITEVPSAAGELLVLSAADLTFEHVNISGASESTPANDGCTTAMRSVSFSVPAEAVP